MSSVTRLLCWLGWHRQPPGLRPDLAEKNDKISRKGWQAALAGRCHICGSARLQAQP